MRCYEVMEKVKRGLLVRYPYLSMGYGDGAVKIPVWGGDRACMQRWLGGIDPGEQFLFTRAGLRTEGRGLWLTTAQPDDQALLLVRTSVGEGGRIEFRHNSRVRQVAAADYQGAPEQLVVMQPGGLLRIKREGGLDGAPPELIVGWDGRRMHSLHESARQF